MNIYDEALEELQNYISEYGMDYYATNHFPITIKALERAKKVEELLEVYKGIDGGGSPEGLNKLYRLRDVLEKELEAGLYEIIT